MFTCLKKESEWSNYQRAIRFFVLNRITFSGTTFSGGFSQESYDKRFTKKSIEKLLIVNKYLEKVEILNNEYHKVLNLEVEKPVIFIDPPYFANKNPDYMEKMASYMKSSIMKN